MSEHARVSEIFLRACSLPPGDRQAFLDEACAGDLGLRTEVEAMLAADAAGSGVLDSRVGALAREVADGTAPRPEWIGPYRILGLLGEGGMGVVYRAQQTTPVRREVALKLVRAGFQSAGAEARFNAERQALAQMEHPSIARLFDAGTAEDGRPYFVMELVQGPAITEHCRTEKLGVRQRVALFLEVCRALRHAHRRGLMHRDLKPSNILVAREGDRPLPKVIDFGIAKALGDSALETEFRTRTGQLVGTLEYMSPEQAAGRVDAVDTRSDVYALGCVLHELLTDRPPHDLAGLPLHEAVRRIVQEPPRSLRGAGVRDSDLATIVGKCLEKEPERRYGSAAELTEDLERYLDARPILARPPNTIYQFRKLVVRHRVGFGVTALAFLFLVVFSVTVTIQLAAQRRERARAQAEARKAERVTEFLREAFKAAREDRGYDATVKQTLDAAATMLARERGGEAAADVAIRQTLGEAYTNFGEHAKADRLLRDALAMQQRRLGAAHPEVALTHRLLAAGLLAAQKGKEAEQEARLALSIHEGQPDHDAREVARDLGVLASVVLFRADESAAGDLTRRQIALYEAMPSDDEVLSELADAKMRLADVLQRGGDIDGSEAIVREVLALRRKAAGGTPTVALATTLADLAFLLGRSSVGCAEATPLYDEALSMTRKIRGPRHAQVATLLIQRSNCLADLRRLDEAAAGLKEATAIALEAVGPKSQTYVSALKGTEAVYAAQGRLDDALALARETLVLARESAGDGSPIVAERWRRLGALLVMKGRFADAEQAFRTPLPIAEKLRPEDLQIAWIVGALANFLVDRGRFEEAQPLHDRAFSITQKKLDPEGPVLAVGKIQRARFLDGFERYAEAEALRAEGVATLGRLFQERHNWIAWALRDRAKALSRQGRLKEALPPAEEAVARFRQLVTANDPRLAEALMDLAEIQARSGASPRAAAGEALSIWVHAGYQGRDRLARARELSAG